MESINLKKEAVKYIGMFLICTFEKNYHLDDIDMAY